MPRTSDALTAAGFRWFPIDTRYRVVGRFVPYQEPRRLAIVNNSKGNVIQRDNVSNTPVEETK